MSTIGRNIDGKIADLRDAFFDSHEKDFIIKAYKTPEGRELYAKMLRKSVEDLYNKAKQLINEVELGMYNEEQMREAEVKIAFCLAAIEDVQLAKILEKDIDTNELGR